MTAQRQLPAGAAEKKGTTGTGALKRRRLSVKSVRTRAIMRKHAEADKELQHQGTMHTQRLGLGWTWGAEGAPQMAGRETLADTCFYLYYSTFQHLDIINYSQVVKNTRDQFITWIF